MPVRSPRRDELNAAPPLPVGIGSWLTEVAELGLRTAVAESRRVVGRRPLWSSGMSRAPRPRAVLFDLYGTLVPGGTRAQRDEVSRGMAELLGVEPALLADLVRRTFDDRTRGRLGDLRETVRWMASQLGAVPPADAIDAAVELRLAMTRRLHEDSWATGALDALGRAGLLLGLVSDCSAETPAIWPTSPLSTHFHAVSFSCTTGRRKPEPEAYMKAVRELGVQPHECVFVGDGGSCELTGAATLGMEAYRFRAPSSEESDSIDADEGWTGPTVTNLMDVVAATSA